MCRRSLFRRAMRDASLALMAVTGAACVDVVSLEPIIGPRDAIPVPGLVGDWIEVLSDGGQYPDTTRVRVTEERDSTRYLVTWGSSRKTMFDRPAVWLRARPAGNRLFAEVTPSRIDIVADSLVERYGALIQLAHHPIMLRVMGDSLHYWLFNGDSIQIALDERRCPSPGRVITRHGALIFTGEPGELQRTTDCLIDVPGVLEEPGVLYRVLPLLATQDRVRPTTVASSTRP